MPSTFPYQQEMVAGSNSFAFVGDSRLSQMFTDSIATYGNLNSLYPQGINSGSNYHIKTNMFFNAANTQLGQRMKVAFNGSVSGLRSDQYLWCMPQAIASGANWLMIWGVVNDIGQSGTTGDTAKSIWLRIKAAAQQALVAGMNVIIVSETGSTSFSATQTGMVFQFNEYAREFCEVTAGAFFYDISRVVIAPASTTIAFISGYSADGMHLNGYGSYYAGVDFANWISSFVPNLYSAPYSSAEIQANGNVQQQPNPLFTTLTGGWAGTGITGNVPSGFTSNCTGSTTCAITSQADPNGYGNNIILTCTFAANGDIIYFGASNTGVSNYTIPGDIVEGGCEAIVNSGSSNFGGIGLYHTYYGTGSNYLWDMYPLGWGGGGALPNAMPTVAMDFVLRSMPTPVVSGITGLGFGMRIMAAGAGSAVVTIKRPWFRRRFAA